MKIMTYTSDFAMGLSRSMLAQNVLCILNEDILDEDEYLRKLAIESIEDGLSIFQKTLFAYMDLPKGYPSQEVLHAETMEISIWDPYKKLYSEKNFIHLSSYLKLCLSKI